MTGERVKPKGGYLRHCAGLCTASVLLGLMFLAAAASAAAPPERLRVTATIFPLADIVRQVGGNRVHVVTMLRPGVPPLSYRPSPLHVRQTVGTDLYVRVGGGFDAWGDGLFTGAAARPLTVTVSKSVAPRHDSPAAQHGGIEVESSGTTGAWLWLDPISVRDRILPAVYEALVRLRPGDAGYFKVNERKFFEELTKLDQAMFAVSRQLPGKGFIATHDIWGALAKRYRLRQAAVMDPVPAGAATENNLDALTDTALKLKIVAVFGDPWSRVLPARELAERIHGHFVMLDPLGGEQLPGRNSYISLMKYNLALIGRCTKSPGRLGSAVSGSDSSEAGSR